MNNIGRLLYCWCFGQYVVQLVCSLRKLLCLGSRAAAFLRSALLVASFTFAYYLGVQ